MSSSDRMPRVQLTLRDDLSRPSIDEASIENPKEQGFKQCVVMLWLFLGVQKGGRDWET